MNHPMCFFFSQSKNSPFSSKDLGRRSGIVTVVSAVSIGADEGLVRFTVGFSRLTKEGVLGVSGFVASSSLN